METTKTTTTEAPAQHTPGPWKVDPMGGILGPKSGCSSPVIANMPVWWAEHRSTGHASQDLQEANARLIAAAPELLQALEAIVAAMTQPVQYTKIRNGASCDVLRADCSFVVNTARFAISKAKGVKS